MKITKFTHSCLLIETEGRAAMFDPGIYSRLDVASIQRLDDIFITHEHPDHMHVEHIKNLRARFPAVRITAPPSAQILLQQGGITSVQTDPPEGVRFFDAPHEGISPLGMMDPPQEYGLHYLDILTDPGDCHHFIGTMPVLALPLTGPWALTVEAVRVALAVRPKYILPVHDWSWRDEARRQMYDRLEQRFEEEGIKFFKLADGDTIEVML